MLYTLRHAVHICSFMLQSHHSGAAAQVKHYFRHLELGKIHEKKHFALDHLGNTWDKASCRDKTCAAWICLCLPLSMSDED